MDKITCKEQLIKWQREGSVLHDKAVEKWILDGKPGKRPSIVEVIADHMIAGGVVVREWIPVAEQLPEVVADVLVYDSTSGEVRYAAMTPHKEWYGVVMSHTVTHWMPLPEPPADMRKGENG